MKKTSSILLLLIPFLSFAQINESFSAKIRKAYSLKGRWHITRMEVNRSHSMASGNANNLAEAIVNESNITVKSELGSYGHFDVLDNGNISGEGEVIFQYRVIAGETGFSMSPIPLPIGASATLHNDDGVRKFRFMGKADTVKRTLKMSAFEPMGQPLQMIVRPTGRTFTSVLWPPMTNIGETEVFVAGSSILFRASGVLSGIKVTFEAVKHVDLAGLFTQLDRYIDERVRANQPRNNSTGSTSTTDPNNNSGNAADATVLAGNVNVAVGGSATVTFARPRANTNYAITFGPTNSDMQITVTHSDKTATGFKIHVKGTGTGSVRVDWMVVGYSR